MRVGVGVGVGVGVRVGVRAGVGGELGIEEVGAHLAPLLVTRQDGRG